MRLRGTTYTEKCPDGSKRRVHRDIDNAFPLHLSKFSGKVAATASDLSGNAVNLDAELEQGINGVLYQLSKLNEGVMLSFRAVYTTYQSDPCGNSEFLARKVDELTSELQRLTATRLELETLVQLADGAENSEQVWNAFADVVSRNKLPGSPLASLIRIKAARRAARRWIEG